MVWAVQGRSRSCRRAADACAARAAAAAAVLAGVLTIILTSAAGARDAGDRPLGAAPIAPPGLSAETYLAPAAAVGRDSVAPFAPHINPPGELRAALGVGQAGKPALWRIQGPKGAVWIFGSVHALPEGTDWRRPLLLRALERAEVVFFETPMDAEAGRVMSATAAADALLPADQKLSDLLSEEGRSLFEAWIGQAPLLRETFERLRPWAAAMSMGADKVGAADGAPGFWMEQRRGVDPQLGLVAAQSGKELRFFKSAADQMRVISGMALSDQVELLESSLRYADDTELMSGLVGDWLVGDLTALERRIYEGPSQMPPGVRVALLDERNIDWARDIHAFLDEGGEALVVGGAAHFVGPGNVLELLAEKGWEIERF